jgi:hypothetical protein
VKNSGKNGICLQTNSVGRFASSANQIIDNKGLGIFCAALPGDPLITGTVGTVSGNALDRTIARLRVTEVRKWIQRRSMHSGSCRDGAPALEAGSLVIGRTIAVDRCIAEEKAG